MVASGTRLMRRAADLAARPAATDAERTGAGLFLLMLASSILAGGLWAVAYVMLGRPLAAFIPGGFAVVVAGMIGWLVATRRLKWLRELLLLLILVLPPLLQLSLGGYVKASAVVVWAFSAPLAALLLFGPRAGSAWTIGFVAVVGICALFDSTATRATSPFPTAVQTALFAFNFVGVAAFTTLVLAYFRVQRDAAMQRSERLLLNVLPPEIAERLKHQEYPIADRFEEVSVLFADMVGFTERSALEPPDQTVAVLNEFLSTFDRLAERHRLRPIRTIGDSYLVVGGIPVARPDHAEAIADMALDMLEEVQVLNQRHGWDVSFRIGISTGPAMAAVVGLHRFTYDVWSDAVNTASRMQSTSVPGRIQVTEATYHLLRGKYEFEARGTIEVKGKGSMTTYFLLSRVVLRQGPDLVAAGSSAL